MSTATSSFPESETDVMANVMASLELVEELGRGARTVVWRARWQGVDYAVKMLAQPIAYDDEGSVAFRREAAMLASVTHPGLARIHEVGHANGRPFMVM